MERKLIQIAESTSMVSLPCKWVRKYNLKKGNALAVEENGAYLVISPSQIASSAEVTFDFTEKVTDAYIRKRILTAYIKGIDVIRVQYADQKIPALIQEYMRDMQNYTIINQTKTELIIKDLSPPQGKELNETIQRVFYLLRELADATEQSLRNREITAAQAIKSMDFNVDRLVYLGLRTINRNGLREYTNNNSLYALLIVLEEIGDQYRRMIKRFIEQPEKTSEQVLQELTTTKEYLFKFQQFYQYPSEAKARELHKIYKEFGPALREIKTETKMDIHILSHIASVRYLFKTLFGELLILNLEKVESG